ncbi:glycosyltransferase [Cellulomonas massiliensis]|uniref:glycosyltransferase n=1 Tax=Cellulomonas massiliensis TaxID=1465811 RepID=UPI0002D8D9A3|nr:glycosyltransferase [Cellulomonas massiliensis]
MSAVTAAPAVPGPVAAPALATVLVPAYEPDERLVHLVRALREAGLPVLVVDDGSGPRSRPVLDAAAAAGADVVHHRVNRGKGEALRTGFAWLAREQPGRDVVCADCDGQHTPADVLAVARRLAVGDAAVVLGARAFTGPVPARSRWGNAATRLAFRLATGRRVRDTQTGLRGYPAGRLAWLRGVPGERFEYELRVLLAAAAQGLRVVEVPIATVYLEGNASSHFRPLVDSVRVWAQLARFVASSLLAFVLDALALLALTAATGSLLASVLGARALSSGVNFLVNRRWVFRRAAHGPAGGEAVRYWLLAAALLAAGYGGLWALTHLHVPLLLAKVATDAALFLVGFQVQRTAVFTGARARER